MKKGILVLSIALTAAAFGFAEAPAKTPLTSLTVLGNDNVKLALSSYTTDSGAKLYEAIVGSDIQDVTIKAVAANGTDKVQGAVKEASLEMGENDFPIQVTDANGTVASYVVEIKRLDIM